MQDRQLSDMAFSATFMVCRNLEIISRLNLAYLLGSQRDLANGQSSFTLSEPLQFI